MSIKYSGGFAEPLFYFTKDCEGYIIKKNIVKEKIFFQCVQRKKRLVRALAEKVFSNREWPVMNRTVCGRYATIKLAYANWVAP